MPVNGDPEIQAIRNPLDPRIVAPWLPRAGGSGGPGISHERLAPTAEMDRSCVVRIERGNNNVSFPTLTCLMSALDTTVAKPMQKARL
jgi:hypothetical protein